MSMVADYTLDTSDAKIGGMRFGLFDTTDNAPRQPRRAAVRPNKAGKVIFLATDSATVNVVDIRKWMQKAEARITACEQLEEDWDGEDGIPSSADAASLAREIIARIGKAVESGAAKWTEPSVSATGDGGLILAWEPAHTRVVLIIGARRQDGIVRVTHPRGSRSSREVESVGDAAQKVIATLCRK